MDRGDGRREDLVRHHLVLATRETSLKSLFPGHTQFRVDVNDIDPGVDRPPEIVIGCAGTAMQSKRYTSRGFDLSNSFDRQMLSLLACNHTLAHTVRIPNGRGQHVHLRLCDKLPGLCRSCQRALGTGTVRVYLRAAADVPNFSFDDHRRVHGLEGLDGLLSRLGIFFQWQRGQVEHN